MCRVDGNGHHLAREVARDGMRNTMPHSDSDTVISLLRPVLLVDAVWEDFYSIVFLVAMRTEQEDVRSLAKILVC